MCWRVLRTSAGQLCPACCSAKSSQGSLQSPPQRKLNQRQATSVASCGGVRSTEAVGAPTNESVGLGGGQGQPHGVSHRMHHQPKGGPQGSPNENGGSIQASLQAAGSGHAEQREVRRAAGVETSGCSRPSLQASQLLYPALHTLHTAAQQPRRHCRGQQQHTSAPAGPSLGRWRWR